MASSPPPRLGLRDLRKVREEMEHERYLMLRRQQKELGLYAPESRLRKEAYRYAVKACQDLLRSENEAIDV